jgi:hypothetical protein
MGGILGNHLHMEALADRWRQMRERHRFDVFHMSDLESFSGEFKGWGRERREALLADIFLCLKDLWIIPFGSVVIVEQYRKLLPQLAQQAFIDPWFMCFQMCVFEAAKTVTWHQDDPTPKEKLAFFHDRQLEYQGRAVTAFHYFKEAAPFGHRLGSITSASMGDVLQLQMADLVAFEIRKLVENGIYYPNIPTRWPMRRLQERPFMCNVMDFTGRVPKLESGPFGVIRRTTTLIRGEELGLIGWPIDWTDEKAAETLIDYFEHREPEERNRLASPHDLR